MDVRSPISESERDTLQAAAICIWKKIYSLNKQKKTLALETIVQTFDHQTWSFLLTREKKASCLQFPSLKLAIFRWLLLTSIQMYSVLTLKSWTLDNMIIFCVVVSKGNVRKDKVCSPQLPSQKRVNLPKETRNPYCVLASWRNRFGNGFREWLTCTAVWVSSWQPQLSTLNRSKKICLILKNMNTDFVIITSQF